MSQTSTQGGSPSGDDVVLLDDAARPIGKADRLTVHSSTTPLHLAFSTYLFNAHGDVLLTRRAVTKATWPGVWTNSACGHPRPGEDLESAARRRIKEELGLTVGPLVPLLPDFRYRATDASGVVENEVCPVYAGFVTDDDPTPDPDEVAEWVWVPWRSLTTAVAAVPQAYSPWAVLQVPQVDRALSAGMAGGLTVTPDLAAAKREVDQLLRETLVTLGAQWAVHTEGLGVDVLAEDLPDWLLGLLANGGKRLRTTMVYWGFIAAGGVQDGQGHRHMVRAAAAIELLHLFALIHDDVMDESDQRRGHPSAHVRATRWHLAHGARGDSDVFGRNLAILLGDLAHALADGLVDSLPESMRRIWRELSVELIAGQRADLTGAAAGRLDRPHAEHVARTKSGRYTVTRPLQLGAAAAGAQDRVLDCLTTCGDHLGRAFALRDDLLGVWGDPAQTGKPAGDDLFEGKATVLLSLARENLTGESAALLARVGTPAFTHEDVPVLADLMREAGVESMVESMITDAVDDAMACLSGAPLARAGVNGLTEAAQVLAWRSA
ncbi:MULTISPECIES: isopentenyl-diphosphate Delta-isomerase [Aestuariimicrobium]|uniref:isopentenyl-diphosphate Delta-isomerase n=1 Tax=Aestuariimicrobium TaxID=396388 RepID=UPI0003B48696|nr:MULTISPECIES: isopentenyl-diphosphate Delta-isomerase [Aestuariimicrobium]CAI9401986.1 Isopentenyl-diphosphate Delta-isomerase [Aestuariimicrobium sp. T2.26MG-19.2B]